MTLQKGVWYVVTKGSDCRTLKPGDKIKPLENGSILVLGQGWIDREDVPGAIAGMEAELNRLDDACFDGVDMSEKEVIRKVLDVDFGAVKLDEACFERLRKVAKGDGYGSKGETVAQLLDIVERMIN